MSSPLSRLKFITILVVILGAACGELSDTNSVKNSRKQELTIYAAASLTEAFSRLGEVFESSHPNVEVVISFAGSQQIAQQLSQGAPGDLFASANAKQMENVISAGRVMSGADQEFIQNQLMVILPGDNPGIIAGVRDLIKPGLRLILADKSTPVGLYSQKMLERANQQIGFGEDYKEKVLGNVVSYEENVRAVLTKITLGEADAGIVYVSDAAGAQGEDIRMIPIPEEINVTASYYIAPLRDSSEKDLGLDFIALVLSPEGQDILNGYGFMKLGQNE
ncbi:MAG TPA: molybdate ABC transporter substrate-binding protein [Anaerolineales bacterium]|nr:molybdate ABC transporter substrate-binding protein [Anaerolineales bacterium]